ncbi:zinc ABC transporter substrate-binding protein [Shinella daejeonensis]|uniref:zinc ABC transporter substrate-binding protein n=1 Tax=Shinella daejeonensis TaxID=659017 RepID=UPI0020C7A81B|nr:zinc ABC transporter substrate-binding protein [Shinella daejeonensis]MCP8893661.1 zinc ABC transporter substrate-binding protein [Shinella daejeonensis]
MNKALRIFLLTTALTATGAIAARAGTPDVVVSVKPIHSLVAAIMQGVGEPGLIVEGAASPHTYSMKPSNATALQKADLVFWVGPGLEPFLEKPLETLGVKATVVELEDAPGLEKLPFREGGPFEDHDHGHAHAEDEQHAHQDGHDHGTETGENHDHEKEAGHKDHEHGESEGHEHGETEGHEHAHEEGHDHDHGAFDSHLWLDPQNARAMAAEIASKLVEKDAANAPSYEANLAALNERLDALDREIVEIVAPVRDKPFIVFHDAYQYFEHRYGVRTAGSITVSPESLPGADRLSKIRQKVVDLGATCVFAEPQFEPKLVNVVLEGTPAKSGTLDPEAATFDAGPELYFTLMKGIATSLRDCLGEPG